MGLGAGKASWSVDIEAGLFNVISVNIYRGVGPLLQGLCRFSEITEVAQNGSLADMGQSSQTQAAVVLF